MKQDSKPTRFIKTALRLAAVAALVVALSGCILIIDPSLLSADLTVELTWDSSVSDLDLYVTYPLDPIEPDGGPEYTIQRAYDASIISLTNAGFYPEDNTGREKIWKNERESTKVGAVRWVSTTRTRTEIIKVNTLPFANLSSRSYLTLPNTTANALPDGATYSWLGIMEVYVYGVSGPVTTPSTSSGAVVTIYNSSGGVLAELPVPEQIHVQGTSVARIALFEAKNNGTGATYAYYQILPHTQIIRDTTGIRSITEVGGQTVIGVEGGGE